MNYYAKALFIVPLLLIRALVTQDFTFYASRDSVCVVGAGPTGLTIAHELEARDYPVTIFEKQSTVGGKCQAYYNTPNRTTYASLGALLFTNNTYHSTLPIIISSGEPLTPGISPPSWKHYIYGPGENASRVTPRPTFNTTVGASIRAEVERYSRYWATEFAPKYSVLRYVNSIPVEYVVPFSVFLERQGYQYLPTIMEMGMVPYGYGRITETLTIYMLQYFTPEVLGVFTATSKSYYIVDFHRVFEHYAGTLKRTTIHLNTTIMQIGTL